MRARLETERLIIRDILPEDAEAVFGWAGDPVVNKYMIYPKHQSPEHTRAWLMTRDLDSPDSIDLGFELKETGQLIGMGGLFYHPETDVWTVGYNLRADKWGNGYVPEAIAAIIEYVRSIREVKAIEGEYAAENEKSGRVMDKLGMTFVRDSEYTKFDGSATFKSKVKRIDYK